MHLFQAHRIDQQSVFAVLATLATLFAAKLARRAAARADVVPTCEGHAWCDSLERQVIQDTANRRHTHL